LGSLGAVPELSTGVDGVAELDGDVPGLGAKGAAGMVDPGADGVCGFDGNGEPVDDGGAPEAGDDGEIEGDGVAEGAGSETSG
jgi:hypothetical protein